VEVIRALAPETVTELDASRWQDLVRDLEALGKVHVIVTSGGATLEVNGAFGHFSDWGGYFNVQTSSLDMHIRNDAVAAVFAVEKPSHMDGIMVQSFQFYSAQGSAAFKVFLSFGGSEAPADRQRRYAELRAHYARQSAGSS
jgi:putative heme iron utilization protein